jgi:hypothetical protein
MLHYEVGHDMLQLLSKLLSHGIVACHTVPKDGVRIGNWIY